MSGLLPILIIGATQSLFSSIIIFTKKPSRLENIFLAILLFIIFLEFNFYILDTYEIYSYPFPVFQFTISPLIYLFVITVTKEKSVFQFKWLFHFLPFIIFTLLINYFAPNFNILLNKYLSFDKNFFFRLLIGNSLFIITIFYLTLSLKVLFKYKKNLDFYYSYKSFKISLNWVILIVLVISIGYLSMFIYSTLLIYGLINYLFNPLGIIIISFFIVSYLIGFFGYIQPDLFNLPLNKRDNQPNTTKEKYSNSKIENTTIEQVLDKLDEIMSEKKPYLKGDLTVDELAIDIGISRSVLTQILNKNLNKNFYKYINEFRIEEAKRLLLNSKYDKFSLLAIGYEAGFNSKSTFNAIFKTYVGKTPSEFKKSNMN